MTTSTANIVLASESHDMLEPIRKHYASRGTLQRDHLIDHMRATGRDELVHYAGAAHRDQVAWQVCIAYLAQPDAPEAELKARALSEAGWGDVSAQDLRAANPGMR